MGNEGANRLIALWDRIDDILTHPDNSIVLLQTRRFGEVIDVSVPGVGGARFSASGPRFIGFLEP